jgi:hypothetical protein
MEEINEVLLCDEGKDLAREAKERWMKRIVFAVYVTWCRPVGETRTPDDEYMRAVWHVPVGTGLYLGCNEEGRAERGLRYYAVVLLRKKLATVGELCTWLDLGEQWQLKEPKAGQGLADFLRTTQEYCGRYGSEAHGEVVNVKRGDAGTQRMLERCGMKRYLPSQVERLTGRMESLQMSESGGVWTGTGD